MKSGHHLARAVLVAAVAIASLSAVGSAAATTVVANISVGANPTAIAINPAGTFAYVANVNANSVSKIDLNTETATATISVGSSPTSIAINPDGTAAYVANQNGHSLTRINLATDATTTINLGAGTLPTGVAIRPDGAYAYVATTDAYVASNASVKKIDLATNAVVGTTSLGVSSYSRLAATPDGAKIIVAGMDSGAGVSRINILDLSTDSVVATRTVSDSQPTGVTVTPSGSAAYVTGTSGFYKINLATNAIAQTLTGGGIGAIGVQPSGNFGFVGTGTGMAKLDLNADAVIAPAFPVMGSQVDAVAINPAGTYGYAVNRMLNTVSKVDLAAKLDQSVAVASPAQPPQTGRSEVLATTATSGLAATLTSETPAVCRVQGQTVDYVGAGTCTVRGDQSGDASTWKPAPSSRSSFIVYLTPPEGEPGISINGARPYTNNENVSLRVVWPPRATSVRLSNDGGFGSATTVTRELAETYPWALDNSIKVLHTKIVYARFSGLGIDETKTYTDDIVLDLAPPEILEARASTTSQAGANSRETAAAPSIRVQLDAEDRLSGVASVQVTDNTGRPGPERDYARVVRVQSSAQEVFVRVQDGAGNWSGWEAVRVSGASCNSLAGPAATRCQAQAAAQERLDEAIAKCPEQQGRARTRCIAVARAQNGHDLAVANAQFARSAAFARCAKIKGRSTQQACRASATARFAFATGKAVATRTRQVALAACADKPNAARRTCEATANARFRSTLARLTQRNGST